MFTVNAAKIGFMEKRKGMLKVGMDADIVILDSNPFETEVQKLTEIKVLETLTGGKTCLLYTSGSAYGDKYGTHRRLCGRQVFL